MQIRSVVVVVALGCSAFAHGQQAVQWRVEDGGNGHWYAKIDELCSWPVAKARCEARGGYLATPTSAAENTFVAQLNAGANAFLGGIRSGGSGPFTWITGEAWAYTNWLSGEPNCSCEPYLHYWLNSSGWNDMYDQFESVFICEWSADCNGDGIVDYGQCRDGSLADYNGNNVPDCCEAGIPCTVGNYPVQWRVEDGGNGHWYQGRRLPTRITWADALDLARSTGGDLASLGSAAELESVFRRVASRVDLWSLEYAPPFIVGPWIGGRGVNGVWSWTDGSAWGFTNWYPGEGVPSSVEQYVHLYSGIGTQINPSPRWADFWAEPMSRSFLVEWAADCNDDGIVDYGQILNGTFADTNENGVPDSCEIDPCPGDITENGLVDGVDLSLVLSLWGTNGQKFPRSDTNDDGIVDAADLAVVLGGWGNCP